jgi:hypothetical protein
VKDSRRRTAKIEIIEKDAEYRSKSAASQFVALIFRSQ